MGRDLGQDKPHDIVIHDNFMGGVRITISGAKNAMIAAIELGLVDKDKALEIMHLIREATNNLMENMTYTD